MAQTHNVITSITTQEQGVNKSFDIGASFENVFLNSQDDEWFYTLENLFNDFRDFLNSASFINYSNKEPTADNVNVWYDTTVS